MSAAETVPPEPPGLFALPPAEEVDEAFRELDLAGGGLWEQSTEEMRWELAFDAASARANLRAQAGRPTLLEEMEAIAATAHPEEAGRPVSCAPAWPDPIGEAAYHGVAGDLVRAVADATEADPVALLGTVLATFGALCGRHSTMYQGSAQAANLFVALVGASSEGRKGTADAIVRAIFTAAVPGWESVLVPGLGSGEGLIARLSPKRDKAGAVTETPDHRALVRETEFGRLLTIMAREGSTLSPTLRDAWDGAPLGRFLARETALVLWHHVGVLAHVTPVELREKLTSVDAANGFGNRFLWLLVRRTQVLPFPGDPRPLVTPHLPALRRALDDAQHVRELTWTRSGAARWREVYGSLGERRRQGLAGELTARAESQVARLALVYALLDCADHVDAVHLDAASAVWAYADQSAACLFGESTGNRHADLVLRLLRERGEVDRQTIKEETGLRLGADLDAVEAALVSAGLAESAGVARPDGTGRRRRVLRLVETGGTGGTDKGPRDAMSPDPSRERYAVPPVSVIGVGARGGRSVPPVPPVSTDDEPVARLAAPEPPSMPEAPPEPPCFDDPDDYRAHEADHYRDGAGWGCRRCEVAP